MNLLIITLAILTAPPAAPIDVPTSKPAAIEAITVFRCDFDDDADKNFDTWPDRWTRRRGPGFPLFVPVKIASEPAANQQPARNFLRIDLDGGAAAIYSPPIPVSSVFSYRLEGELRTLKLKHDVAYYSLTFFDPDGRVLETHESPHHHDTRQWTRIDVGPIAPTNPDCYTAVVGLHLRPRSGGQSDLQGSAQFANIEVSRLPRVVLRCQQKHHIHTQADQVELLCDVSGVLRSDPLVTFTLRDVEGKVLATHETQLAALPSVSNHIDNTRGTEGHVDGQGTSRLHAEITARDEPAQVRGFAGRARWKPPVPGTGFYRVQVAMRESDTSELERETTFVVARPLAAATAGEFGWSLPHGDEHMSLADLVPLVGQAGLHWLKFPMWFSADDATRPDRLAWFADRTGMQHIELIGVLDTPPEALRKSLGDHGKLPIATAFVEAPFWQPAVDPVMSRLSLKVRYWQLGADTDTSFVGFPQLGQKITDIKRHFLKYGQEVQVGFVWPWL
ncbi:MAG TPA: hypothetical protein VL096_04465, partial [Pirellulaceae bacterium]|nr:hypothetical protein [Pirellulaceae bacterium]